MATKKHSTKQKKSVKQKSSEGALYAKCVREMKGVISDEIVMGLP